MPAYNYSSGLGSTGQYIISGRPFITGSTIRGGHSNNGEICITFPTVTKSLTIVNRGDETILVHFDSRTNSDVINHFHYMSLPNRDDSYGFDIRCTKVYVSMDSSLVSSSFELHAELTGISSNEMHALTGSGINSDD